MSQRNTLTDVSSDCPIHCGKSASVVMDKFSMSEGDLDQQAYFDGFK